MKNVIYKITIKGSDKFYIGSALDFLKRRKKHLHELRHNIHPNRHLQNSYNKNGKDDAFLMDIIEEVESSEQLIEREQFFIDSFDSERLFNLRLKAESSLGIKASKETREKIRKNSLHRYLSASEEDQKKFSQYWKGKKRGKKHGEMVAENNRTRKVSDKTKEKIRLSQIGKKLSDAHIQKIREGNIGKQRTDESKLKISQALKGKSKSAKAKKNMSLSHSRKRAIQQLDINTSEVINEFESIMEAARKTGYHYGAIQNCCHGRSKTSNGYKWRYKLL